MDVFALSKHEYLQPPISKHGRSSNVQQQQQQSTSHQSGGTPVSSGNQGSGGGTGAGAGNQTSFSTGMFGNMNQSSSS